MTQPGGGIVQPLFKKNASFQKDQGDYPAGVCPSLTLSVVRMALAALFICGGVFKLFDPKAFAATISAYNLVPDALLPVFAIGLPLIETIAGLALVFDRSWGLHLITGLLVLFVFVLGYGILGDLDVDCGCFGVEDLDKQTGLRAAFYRDLILIGIVAPYLYLSRRARKFSVTGRTI